MPPTPPVSRAADFAAERAAPPRRYQRFDAIKDKLNGTEINFDAPDGDGVRIRRMRQDTAPAGFLLNDELRDVIFRPHLFLNDEHNSGEDVSAHWLPTLTPETLVTEVFTYADTITEERIPSMEVMKKVACLSVRMPNVTAAEAEEALADEAALKQSANMQALRAASVQPTDDDAIEVVWQPEGNFVTVHHHVPGEDEAVRNWLFAAISSPELFVKRLNELITRTPDKLKFHGGPQPKNFQFVLPTKGNKTPDLRQFRFIAQLHGAKRETPASPVTQFASLLDESEQTIPSCTVTVGTMQVTNRGKTMAAVLNTANCFPWPI
jgi:hypothetical protein